MHAVLPRIAPLVATLGLALVTGCGPEESSPPVPSIERRPLDLGQIVVSGASATGFDVVANVAGDTNGNGTAVLRYCAAPCDPRGSGVSVPLTRTTDEQLRVQFTGRVVDPDWPSSYVATVLAAVVAEDPDGVRNSPALITVNLPVNYRAVTLTSVTLRDPTSTGFVVEVGFRGDVDADSSATAFYCPLRPVCDPMFGGTIALQREAGVLRGVVDAPSWPALFVTAAWVEVAPFDPDGIDQAADRSAYVLLPVPYSAPASISAELLVPGYVSVSFGITGDIDGDAQATAAFCNRTDSPNCSAIGQVALTRDGQRFVGDLPLGPDDGMGDTLLVSADLTDPDGQASGGMSTLVVVP